MSPAVLQEPADLLALETALREERAALLANNVEALLVASNAKLFALRSLEANPPSVMLASRVAQLAELNRSNGVLLTRRRRVVDWTLRQLGRQANESVYDTRGGLSVASHLRALGIG